MGVESILASFMQQAGLCIAALGRTSSIAALCVVHCPGRHALRWVVSHRRPADLAGLDGWQLTCGVRPARLSLEPGPLALPSRVAAAGAGVRSPMSPSQWRTAKRFASVLGHQMAYVEAGTGRPIVLLHGNPTSSYLWRSVLPALQGLGRCIVPDLIGMGDSDKLGPDDPERYTFARHREFVDALLEVLGVGGDAVLVVHDWGSALGFDWARRHPRQVAAIAYMEALVRPIDGWDEWPENARSIFQRLRSPAGDELILERNVFVERILPASVLRPLTAEEMGEYRRPFAAPGDGRLPTLIWPRQIPIAGGAGRRAPGLRCLRGLAGVCPGTAQAVHQRPTGQHPDRRRPGLLPSLAGPSRGDRARHPFHPGRLRRRNRPRHRRLASAASRPARATWRVRDQSAAFRLMSPAVTSPSGRLPAISAQCADVRVGCLGLKGAPEWTFCAPVRRQDSPICLLGQDRARGRGRPDVGGPVARLQGDTQGAASPATRSGARGRRRPQRSGGQSPA